MGRGEDRQNVILSVQSAISAIVSFLSLDGFEGKDPVQSERGYKLADVLTFSNSVLKHRLWSSALM